MKSVAERVVERWLGTSRESWRVMNLRNSKIFAEDDTVYSYGHHYKLAVRLKNPAVGEFLLNTCRYSNTTTGHQRVVESEISDSFRKMRENFDLIAKTGIALENYNEIDASRLRKAFLSWRPNTLELMRLPRGKIVFDRTDPENTSYLFLYPNIKRNDERGWKDGRIIIELKSSFTNFLEAVKSVWPSHDPLRSIRIGAISLGTPTEAKKLGIKKVNLKRMVVNDGAGDIVLIGAIVVDGKIWCNRGAQSNGSDSLKSVKIDPDGRMWNVCLPNSDKVIRFEI